MLIDDILNQKGKKSSDGIEMGTINDLLLKAGSVVEEFGEEIYELDGIHRNIEKNYGEQISLYEELVSIYKKQVILYRMDAFVEGCAVGYMTAKNFNKLERDNVLGELQKITKKVFPDNPEEHQNQIVTSLMDIFYNYIDKWKMYDKLFDRESFGEDKV